MSPNTLLLLYLAIPYRNYVNGYDADYTCVILSLNNSGATFNLSGYVKVTKDQYTSAARDINQLKSLIL
ncbi:hypothetical protein [Heyndrickxia camelliae]|uniref:Uncharacterized protein n=1 Tax=Heyndrickxia camelliae TaxID=1707093 RepID=A0A2N3LD17_9BACI|nr:hypothetical protein [Heyndrickxia camelliae]PKR82437.1 hypothetical protein CWO92_24340 [Heyndrickxia camelliae]